MTWDGISWCVDCTRRPAEHQRAFAMIDGTIIVDLICADCYQLEHQDDEEARRG